MFYYTKETLLLHAPLFLDQIVIDVHEFKRAALGELVLTHADCCLEDLDQVCHVIVACLLDWPDCGRTVMPNENY